MDDYDVMAKILVAIMAGQDEPQFDFSLLNEKTLKTTKEKKNRLLKRLQKEGYIDGICIDDTIDNMPSTIVWKLSRPELTIKGMEYIKTSMPLHRALEEMKTAGIAVAGQVISTLITNL